MSNMAVHSLPITSTILSQSPTQRKILEKFRIPLRNAQFKEEAIIPSLTTKEFCDSIMQFMPGQIIDYKGLKLGS